VTSRDERVAANEATFRDANEVIRGKAAELLRDGGDLVPFLCECADKDCTRVVLLTLDEYEAVRANPHTFAIVRAHAATASERVVGGIGQDGDEFAVVEKKPPAHAITEQTNPRRT